MSNPTNPPPPGATPAPGATQPAPLPVGAPAPRAHLPLEELTKRLAEAEHRITKLEAERSAQAESILVEEGKYDEMLHAGIVRAKPEVRTKYQNHIKQMKERLIAVEAFLATERDGRDRIEERIARHHEREEARRDKEEARQDREAARQDREAARRSQWVGHGMTFASLVVAALGIIFGQCGKSAPQDVKVTCVPGVSAPASPAP